MSENTHKFNLNAAFNLKSLTIDKGTLSTLSNSLEDAFKGPIQNAVSEFQKQIDAKKPSGKSPASGKETTLKLGGVKKAAGSFAKEVSKVLTKELASTSIKLNIDKTAATNAFKSIFNAVVADMKAHSSDGGPPGGSGSPPSGGGGSGDDLSKRISDITSSFSKLVTSVNSASKALNTIGDLLLKSSDSIKTFPDALNKIRKSPLFFTPSQAPAKAPFLPGAGPKDVNIQYSRNQIQGMQASAYNLANAPQRSVPKVISPGALKELSTVASEIVNTAIKQPKNNLKMAVEDLRKASTSTLGSNVDDIVALMAKFGDGTEKSINAIKSEFDSLYKVSLRVGGANAPQIKKLGKTFEGIARLTKANLHVEEIDALYKELKSLKPEQFKVRAGELHTEIALATKKLNETISAGVYERGGGTFNPLSEYRSPLNQGGQFQDPRIEGVATMGLPNIRSDAEKGRMERIRAVLGGEGIKEGESRVKAIGKIIEETFTGTQADAESLMRSLLDLRRIVADDADQSDVLTKSLQLMGNSLTRIIRGSAPTNVSVGKQAQYYGGVGKQTEDVNRPFAIAAKTVADNLKDFNGGLTTSDELFTKLKASTTSVEEFRAAFTHMIGILSKMRGDSAVSETGRKDVLGGLKESNKQFEAQAKQGLPFEEIKAASSFSLSAFSGMSKKAIEIVSTMGQMISPTERVRGLFDVMFTEAQGDVTKIKGSIDSVIADLERAKGQKFSPVSKEGVAAAKALRTEIEAFSKGKATQKLSRGQQFGLLNSEIKAREKQFPAGEKKQVFTYQVKDETGQRFKTLRVELKRTADESNRLKMSIKELPSAVNALGGSMQTAFRKVALYGAAAGITYGAVNAFRNAIKVMSDVEVGVIKIGKVMNSATADFAGFQDQVLETASKISTEFGSAIQDVLQTMFTFAQQGLPMPDVTALAETTALAANVTNLAGPQAAEALTAAFRQFNMEAKDSVKILDSWNEVANNFAVEENVLADAMKKSGVAARNAGLSFDEFNGIVAALGSATRQKGGEIGTSMKFIFQRLTRPIAVSSLKKVGVDVADAAGNFRGVMGVLGDLDKVWSTLTNTQRLNIAQSVAGIRQYNAFLTIMDEFDVVTKATESSTKSQGSAMRENAKVMQSASKQWAVMIEKIKQTAIEMGSIFLPVAKGVMGVFSGLVGAVNALPTPLKAVAGGFAIIGVASIKAAEKVDMLLTGLSSIPANAAGIGPAISSAFRSIGSAKVFDALPEAVQATLNAKKDGGLTKAAVQVGDFSKGGVGAIAESMGATVGKSAGSMTKFSAAVRGASIAADGAVLGVSDMNSIFSKLGVTVAKIGQKSFGYLVAGIGNVVYGLGGLTSGLSGASKGLKTFSSASIAADVAAKGFWVSLGALAGVILAVYGAMKVLGWVYDKVFGRGDKIIDSMKEETAAREEQLDSLRKTGNAYSSLARERRKLARVESIISSDTSGEEVSKLKSEGRFISPVSIKLSISDKESRLLENLGPLALDAVEGFDLFGNAVVKSSDALTDYSGSAIEAAANQVALAKATAAAGAASELVGKSLFKWTNALEQFEDAEKNLKNFASAIAKINNISVDFVGDPKKPSKYFGELQKDMRSARAEVDKYTNKMNELLDTLPRETGVSFFQELATSDKLSKNLEALASVANRQLAPAFGAVADKTDILNSVFVKTKTGLKDVGEVGEKTLASFESAGFSAIEVTGSNLSSVSAKIRENARNFNDSVALITEPGRSFMKNALVTLNSEGDAVISFFDEFGNYVKKSLSDLVGEGGKIKIIEKGSIVKQLEEEFLNVKKIITGAGAGTSFAGDINLGARLNLDLTPQQRIAKDLPGLFKQATLAQNEYNKTLADYTKQIGESSSKGKGAVDLTKRISSEMVDELNRLSAKLNFGALLVRFASDLQEIGIQAEKSAQKLEELKASQVVDSFVASFKRGAEKGLIENLKFEPVKVESDLTPKESFQKTFGKQLQGLARQEQEAQSTKETAVRFDVLKRDLPKLVQQFKDAQKEFRNPEEVETFARALRDTGDVGQAIDKTASLRTQKTLDDQLKSLKSIDDAVNNRKPAKGGPLSAEQVKGKQESVLLETNSLLRKSSQYFRDTEKVSSGKGGSKGVVKDASDFISNFKKLSEIKASYQSAAYLGKSPKELSELNKKFKEQGTVTADSYKSMKESFKDATSLDSDSRKKIVVALKSMKLQGVVDSYQGFRGGASPLEGFGVNKQIGGIINKLVVGQAAKGKTSLDTTTTDFKDAVEEAVKALLISQGALEKRKSELQKSLGSALPGQYGAISTRDPAKTKELNDINSTLAGITRDIGDREALERLVKKIAEEQLKRVQAINDLKKSELEEEKKRAQDLINYFQAMINEMAGVSKGIAGERANIVESIRVVGTVALGIATATSIINKGLEDIGKTLTSKRLSDDLKTPISGALRGVTSYQLNDLGKQESELTPAEALSKRFPELVRSFDEFGNVVSPNVQKQIMDINDQMTASFKLESDLRKEGRDQEANFAKEHSWILKETRDKLKKTFEGMRDDMAPVAEGLRKMMAATAAAQQIDKLVEGLKKFQALQYNKKSINDSLGQGALAPVTPGGKDKFETEKDALERKLRTTLMTAEDRSATKSRMESLDAEKKAAIIQEKNVPQAELFQKQVQAGEAALDIAYEAKKAGVSNGQELIDTIKSRLEHAGDLTKVRTQEGTVFQRRGVDISDIDDELRKAADQIGVSLPKEGYSRLETFADNQLGELKHQTQLLQEQLNAMNKSGDKAKGSAYLGEKTSGSLKSYEQAGKTGVPPSQLETSKFWNSLGVQQSTYTEHLTKRPVIGGGLPTLDNSSVVIQGSGGSQGMDQSRVEKALSSMDKASNTITSWTGKVHKLMDLEEKDKTRGYAYGGHVFGSPGVDRVPAMLTAGEYVINRSAVGSIGLSKLEYMNRSGNVPKFAGGGFVGGKVRDNGSAVLDAGPASKEIATSIKEAFKESAETLKVSIGDGPLLQVPENINELLTIKGGDNLTVKIPDDIKELMRINVSSEEASSSIKRAFSDGAALVKDSLSVKLPDNIQDSLKVNVSSEDVAFAIKQAFSDGASLAKDTLDSSFTVKLPDNIQELLTVKAPEDFTVKLPDNIQELLTVKLPGDLVIKVPDNIQELLTVKVSDVGAAGPGARRIDALEGSVEILMDKVSNIDRVISQGAFGSGITLEDVDLHMEARLNEVTGSFDVKLNDRFSTTSESMRAEFDSKISNKVASILPDILDSKNTAVQALTTAQSAMSRALLG